ncbi:hypothetical protein Psuf_067800 [Phytohabitans suffuscus]|uniref:Uncharacterized protein n=1 Tax=Phytohabitans suffuscus TaxID=624315 RepID=A0A6F8YTK1_9ACTN|nr:hypothetical protein Psuf_067800 [Phytohabitans suffuscus]
MTPGFQTVRRSAGTTPPTDESSLVPSGALTWLGSPEVYDGAPSGSDVHDETTNVIAANRTTARARRFLTILPTCRPDAAC